MEHIFMSGQLLGKIAMVTGANKGIGRAAALLFAREGATVIVCARNSEEGENVAAQARALGRDHGGDAQFLKLDITEAGVWPKAINAIVTTHKGLHVAFNNAAILGDSNVDLVDQTEESFDEVIAVNLKSVFLAMRAQIPAMITSGGGSIINTASVGGIVGNYGVSPYVGAKHGVVGLTRAAALEYVKQGIRVNAIAPGGTDTQMLNSWMEQPGVREHVEAAIPIERLARPEEIANAALWLASDAASYVTGVVLPVDAGHTAR
jgi:NAD(P)-dependent dehydrogenase (short-subunit alcohol dehydrogenase family)